MHTLFFKKLRYFKVKDRLLSNIFQLAISKYRTESVNGPLEHVFEVKRTGVKGSHFTFIRTGTVCQYT